MQPSKKINVLVIPDLFPKYKGDVQGIFILDYLSSTTLYCNNTVLFGKLINDQKNIPLQSNDTFELKQFSISSKKIPFILKPFAYFLWFIKGYQIGKQIQNVDIIHAHGTILSGTLSFLLSKKKKVPFIITEHQGPFSMTSENFWKLNWTKYIMKKADAVLTVSKHLKYEILNANINPKKIIVTYNPVDTELFKLKNDIDFKTILFVGRLDAFKGALRSLKAFEAIHEHYPDWNFTIIGDGEEFTPLKSYLNAKPNLNTKVKLMGQLSKSEIALQMRNSSFLIFPSKHESFGLVITEALSVGLPVIVGNTTAPKEFVNSENGILVTYNDLEEITSALKTLINKHSSYNFNEIRQKIIADFGFESFGKKMADIYASIVK